MLGKHRIKRDVLCDCLETDMGNGSVLETLRRIVPLFSYSEMLKSCRQESLARNCNCYSTRVHRYPTSTPLLSDVRSCATSAGRIDNEIAGICSHKYTSLNDAWRSLHNVLSFG